MSHRTTGPETMLIPFNRIADSIDRVNAAIGRAAAWCSLFVVLAEFATVVMRYVFGIGSIAVQESVLYAQAALFLLAAAWVLQIGGHVRIDVFYAPARPRTRALIDLCGALIFLIPFAVGAGRALGSLRRALVGNSRTLARGQRLAVCLSVQDADPRVCCSHRPARCGTSDPRRARARGAFRAVTANRPRPRGRLAARSS